MLPLFVLVPLALLMIVNLPVGQFLRRWSWGLTLLLTIAQAAALICFAPHLKAGGFLATLIPLTLELDNLSCVMLLAIAIVVGASLLVARGTVSGMKQLSNFASLVLIAMAGMNALALLRDLFSLWLFFEVVGVASFVLIAFRRDRGALEGAFTYIILSGVATVLMLGGLAILMLVGRGESSPLTFANVQAALQISGGLTAARLGIGMFLCGLLIKGGLVPFHGWLPGAYSAANAPASVLLAGIVTKATGVYGLMRVVSSVIPPTPGVNAVVLFAGAAAVVIGALGALYQSEMKRLFAYSSISQVGYILLGLGCGGPLGMLGATLHLFNHAIFKSLLFVNAAAVEQRVGTTDMTRLGGLGSKMPWTNVTSLIATLSTAGVPPLSGFWSKLIIVVALWQGAHYGYAVVAILFSLVTLGYLLLMQRKVFFGEMPAELANTREASPSVVISAVVLAGITFGMGVLFPLLLKTFLLPVKSIFPLQ